MSHNPFQPLIEPILEQLQAIRADLDALKKTSTPNSDSEFLTRREVADLLKISLGTVDNAAAAGHLKKVYFGKSVRFRRADVLALPDKVKAGRLHY